VVGSIGRLNEQKGHRYLLDAAPAVLRAHPDARFLIVGDGDLAEPLRRQAQALGLADRVVFAGHRGDVPEMLGAIDVLCLPSLYEGTPLALFEAMAAGKAIVASAVDGCAEVLADGTTGLLVPPRDPAALGAAVVRPRRPGLSSAWKGGPRGVTRLRHRHHRAPDRAYDEVLAERRPARAA
jgi:glycosyltransferase involved in cell wall biosynthesis